MTATQRDVQREGFTRAIESGDYADDFRHAPKHVGFAARVLAPLLAERSGRVLEVGCGNGAGLREVAAIAGASWQLHGFDLTPAMIGSARRVLRDAGVPAELKLGDALDPAAYAFPSRTESGFDLVYAYDLVQQLPRAEQFAVCLRMYEHVAPGGSLVVFDHERWSGYGLRMGFRKLVTRSGLYEWVPRYFCNARYPSLRELARRLGHAGSRTQIITDCAVEKRALVACRPAKVV